MRERITDKIKNSSHLALFGSILIAIAIISLSWFFLRGETKVNGWWAGVKKSETLVCSIKKNDYPFFTYNEAQDKNTRINVVFNSGEVDAISLVHTMRYDSEKAIIDSENINHLAMNKKFNIDGLGFDALGLKFSKFNEGLQMSLYVDKINEVVAKYFMLNDMTGDYGMTEMQLEYEKQGFGCRINNN